MYERLPERFKDMCRKTNAQLPFFKLFFNMDAPLHIEIFDQNLTNQELARKIKL
jgi:hypothetical protein